MYFLEFGLREWLIGLGILAGMLVRLWRQKRNRWYLLAFAGMGWYCLLLFSVTLFPIPLDTDIWVPAGLQPWQYTLQQVNLIPFNYRVNHQIEFATAGSILHEVLQNILMTVPFGFGVNFLKRLNVRESIWVAFLAGASIETAQLLISLVIGHLYHIIDITDVILNTTGVLIGYGCFHLFCWMYRRGLRTFIDQVVQQE